LTTGKNGNHLETTDGQFVMSRDTYAGPAVRAQRYLIRTHVRYRPCGHQDWYDGRTENISRSGILIRTPHVIAVQTPIEILLELPAEVGGEPDATVICEGRIVRTEPPGKGGAEPAVAATIARYVTAQLPDNDPRRI
jgi:hypothetical protein